MLHNVRALRSGDGKAVAKLLVRSLLISASMLAASAQPTSAQVGPVAQASCAAHIVKVHGHSDLRVVCGKQNGVRIGAIDSYDAVANQASGALVIRALTYGRARVFFIFPDASGRPVLQELTRDLARSAGRHADAGLENVTIDLKLFASSLTIGLDEERGGDSRLRTKRHTLDLGSYLALGRQLLPTGTSSAPADAAKSGEEVVQ